MGMTLGNTEIGVYWVMEGTDGRSEAAILPMLTVLEMSLVLLDLWKWNICIDFLTNIKSRPKSLFYVRFRT